MLSHGVLLNERRLLASVVHSPFFVPTAVRQFVFALRM
jgi:hypothetical protein